MKTRLTPFLTATEIRDEYRIGLNRIRGAIKSGELRSYRPNSKSYHVDPKDVEEWIRKFPVNAPDTEMRG